MAACPTFKKQWFKIVGLELVGGGLDYQDIFMRTNPQPFLISLSNLSQYCQREKNKCIPH